MIVFMSCVRHPRPPPLSPSSSFLPIHHLADAPVHHSPVRSSLLHPHGDGLELLIDAVVKREMDADWMLCV